MAALLISPDCTLRERFGRTAKLMMQILENLRERISQLKTGNYPTNLTNLPFTRRA
jgi:hypothetical protein